MLTNMVYGELCDKTKITVRWPNGTKRCWPCASCRRGWGATYSCGDVINAPLKTPLKCVKCKRRHTYSAGRSSDRCKKCTTCQPNRKIIKKCTRSADTQCGGCKAGYYKFRDPHFSICEKCSPCCDDAKDKRIEECAHQGLPRNRQCSFHQGRNCSLIHLTPRSSRRVLLTRMSNIDHQLDQKLIASTVPMKPTRDQKSTTFPGTTKPPVRDQKITSTSTYTMKLAVDQKPSTLKIKPEAANNHIVHINNSVDSTTQIAIGLYIFLPLLIIALAVIFGMVMYKRKQKAKQTEDQNTSVEQNSLTSDTDEGSTDVDCEQGGQEPRKDGRQFNNDWKEKENEFAQDAVSSCPLKKFMNVPEYEEFCRLLNTKLHPLMVNHYHSISKALGVTDRDIINKLMEDEKGAAQALFEYISVTAIKPVTLEKIAHVLDRLNGRAPAAKMLREADNHLKQQEA